MIVSAVILVILLFYKLYDIGVIDKKIGERIAILSERFENSTSGMTDEESIVIRNQFNLDSTNTLTLAGIMYIRNAVSALTYIIAATIILDHLVK